MDFLNKKPTYDGGPAESNPNLDPETAHRLNPLAERFAFIPLSGKIPLIKGLKVRKSVTNNLAYLVIGETPGEKKIEKAENQGVVILRLDEYLQVKTFIKKSKNNNERNKQVKELNKESEHKPKTIKAKKHQHSVDITSKETIINMELNNNPLKRKIKRRGKQKDKIKSDVKSQWIYLAILLIGIVITVLVLND